MTRGTKIKAGVILISVLLILVVIYRFNPYRVSFLGHYDKIWAHRVNDTNKLVSAIQYFEGIELDLIYLEDTNTLDVNHPPAPSTGLTFEVYLSKIENGQRPFMWLDIKNLKASNADRIFEKLTSLFQESSYPLNMVLIESRYPEALPRFTNAGFKTSYYLPTKPSENINVIDSVLQSQPNIAISSSYTNYETMIASFPKKTKYIWILNHDKFKEYSLVRRILKDTTVKVVLVPYRPLY